MYWTMWPRWRLAIDITISSKLIYFGTGDGGGGDIVALQGDRGPAGARGF